MFTTIALAVSLLGLALVFVFLFLTVAQIATDHSPLIPAIGFLLGAVMLTGGAVAYPGNDAAGTPGLMAVEPAAPVQDGAAAPAGPEDGESGNEEDGESGNEEDGESGNKDAVPVLEGHSSGDLGDYHIDVKGAFLATDLSGNPAIVINYIWTNKGELLNSAGEGIIPKTVVQEAAFQDGVQLENAILLDVKGYQTETGSFPTSDGKPVTIQCAYVLENETSPVNFQIVDPFGRAETAVTDSFDLSILG